MRYFNRKSWGVLMLPDTVMARLEAIPTISASGKRVNGLHRLMRSPLLWEQGLRKIASNRGAMTPGIDGKTFEDFGPDRLAPLIASVATGAYKPKPVRRVSSRKAKESGVRWGFPRETTASSRKWHANCWNESMSRSSRRPRMDFDREDRVIRPSST